MSDQESSKMINDENSLIAERRTKLNKLREKGNPFPNHFRRTATAEWLQNEYKNTTKQELISLSSEYAVSGRLIRNRGSFLLLKDGGSQIQLYVNHKVLPAFILDEINGWDLGDIVAAKGSIQRSGKGELYIDMEEAQLLTKALRPLPDKYHGLTDQELRYRQRYVDLIVNDDSRRVFETRSKAVSFIRKFMDSNNFIEVETPMMHPIPGGAVARPFVTHHNTLGQDMFLRVAPELYLKRLIVGGFDKVYELNRNFRNEGLSTRHNPEFTMLEFYWAYADYHDAMNLTENMIRSLFDSTVEESVLKYQDDELNLKKPFVTMTVADALIRYNDQLGKEQLHDLDELRKYAELIELEWDESWGIGKIQIEIFEKTVEPKLIQPTFIIEYPVEVSPLARRNDQVPTVADRFELFVCGRELANGFSELNDSEDQADRFNAQVKDKEAGDSEAMHFDFDYVRALEYGMPPATGVGIGIDRLVMLLTNTKSIRDVLLFPHMRTEN